MPVTRKTTPSPWSAYERAVATAQRRTIALLFGEVGTGKTRFGLTAPGPILVQSLDKGTEGVVDDILKQEGMEDKEIYVKEYDWDPAKDDFSQEYAQEIRDEIIKDFNHARQHARTCIWDKETDIWGVFRYAEFGGPSDAPKNYDRLNQRYWKLLNDAKASAGFNFFLIQGMKDEWGSETKVDPQSGRTKKSPISTGRRIRSGFGRLDEIVMLELHFRREKGEFLIDVGKARQQSASNPIQDTTVPGCTFAEFGTLLVPDSEKAEWE